MAYPLSGDIFSAVRAAEQQKSAAADDRRARPRRNAVSPGHTAARHADIEHAHQRLTQEVGAAPGHNIGSADEARRRAATTVQLLGDAPASGLRAHGAAHQRIVEAAMAGPTV